MSVDPSALQYLSQFKGFESYSGGNKYFALTNAMGTNAQLVKSVPTRVCRLVNTAGGSCAVTIYDCGTTDATQLAAAEIVWQGTVTAGAPIDLQIPMNKGIVVAAHTAAVANDVLVTYV